MCHPTGLTPSEFATRSAKDHNVNRANGDISGSTSNEDYLRRRVRIPIALDCLARSNPKVKPAPARFWGHTSV